MLYAIGTNPLSPLNGDNSFCSEASFVGDVENRLVWVNLAREAKMLCLRNYTLGSARIVGQGCDVVSLKLWGSTERKSSVVGILSRPVCKPGSGACRRVIPFPDGRQEKLVS